MLKVEGTGTRSSGALVILTVFIPKTNKFALSFPFPLP
jgi:hypothetical protein